MNTNEHIVEYFNFQDGVLQMKQTASEPEHFVKFLVDKPIAFPFLKPQQGLIFLDNFQKLNEWPQAL